MSKRIRLLVWTALLALFVLPDMARADEPPYFAITNVRIVTVSGATIDNGTVFIAKGLIAAVGKDVTLPPEAWIIDGKGLTVYPGLIDAMTDLGLQSAGGGMGAGRGGAGQGAPNAQQQQTRVSRGPEDRPATTPWINAADELNPDDKRMETWRNSGFTSALIAPQNGIFPGQGAIVNLGGSENGGDMVIKAPAVMNITFQAAGGFTGFPGSLMGVLAYVKQVFLDTARYAETDSIYASHPRGLEQPAYDRTVRSVNEALKSGRPVFLPANTAAQIMRALELTSRFSLKSVVYGAQEGYAAADALAEKKVPVLVSLKWPEKNKDADPDAEESLRVLRYRDRAPSSPAALEKAGIKFAFYSDGITAPKDMLKNAKKAVDAGLKPEAAVRAFTLNAAEILGVADQLGSIDQGKIANLVLTDGDIFNEKTKVKMVFVRGHRYEIREPSRPTEPPAGNLTGKWSLTINTPQGSQPGTADLTMAPDGTLSGSVSGQLGVSTITSGYLSGNKFSFTTILPIGGGREATFSGTLEGGQMKGTISFGGFNAEFTGTKPNADKTGTDGIFGIELEGEE